MIALTLRLDLWPRNQPCLSIANTVRWGRSGHRRWNGARGLSRKRKTKCISWLKPSIPIHLLCPDSPQITVTVVGWSVSWLVGLSVGQENSFFRAFLTLKVAVFISLLLPTSGQQGVVVCTALFKIFPCQDLATIFSLFRGHDRTLLLLSPQYSPSCFIFRCLVNGWERFEPNKDASKCEFTWISQFKKNRLTDNESLSLKAFF